MESLQIPKRLMQTLRRRAEELGVTPEELLIELMVDAVDPGERPQAYIDAAREMLEQAKKELGSGDDMGSGGSRSKGPCICPGATTSCVPRRALAAQEQDRRGARGVG